ncbi:MAG: hypothetical protein ABI843_02195 [Dokdonella sp.]
MKRKAAVLMFAAGRLAASAAVPTEFAVYPDNPAVVQSVQALNKGDVIEIHSFKAEPGMLVALGMCDTDCRSIHLAKAVPTTREGQTSTTERVTLPEDGQIFL